MVIYSKLIANGSFLPDNIIKNSDLDPKLQTSDTWITERTGIKQRHIAADDETTSELSYKAILNSKIDPNILDGIIVATSTPDLIFPSTAILTQQKLGIKGGFAFDINAACAGFIYALQVADSMIKNGLANRIAVVGAETMSRVTDWTDRSTCVLFGDGAGTFILEKSFNPGIISSNLNSDSSKSSILKIDGGVSKINPSAKIEMNGKEVFKIAVEGMSKSILTLLESENINPEQLDWVLAHQANQRILSSVASRLSFPVEKVISTIAQHANTSAASIPLAFDVFRKSGQIKDGHLMCLSGIGAGMTWGSILIKV